MFCVLGSNSDSVLGRAPVNAQETTGGLQETVKDSSGAVVPNAHVEVKGSSLVGSKSIDTDSAGSELGRAGPTVTALGSTATSICMITDLWGKLPA